MEAIIVLIPVAIVVILAVGWFIESSVQKKAAREVAAMRARGELPPRPKIDSWEGSAEQKMLHANDEIRRWSSDQPH
jgi:hypothetical protein